MQVDEARKTGGLAQAVRCDVSCQQQQEQMFDAHMQAYGRLDTAVLNAGIGETGEHGCVVISFLEAHAWSCGWGSIRLGALCEASPASLL